MDPTYLRCIDAQVPLSTRSSKGQPPPTFLLNNPPNLSFLSMSRPRRRLALRSLRCCSPAPIGRSNNASFLLRRLRLLPSDSAERAIAVSVNFGDVPGHAAEKRNGRCGANPEAHSRSTGLPLSADCGRQTTLA